MLTRSLIEGVCKLILVQEELQRIDDMESPTEETAYGPALFDLKCELDELCKTLGLSRKAIKNL